MEVVRANYNKSQTSDDFVEPTAWTVLKAHLALRYFINLQLIQTQNYTYMDTFETTESSLKDQKKGFKYELFKEFVSSNPDFFDFDLKVGVFGLGMLVKYTMNIQYANLGSTPFEKKLKGYDLSLHDLSKIYTETLDKMRQYSASGAYSDLREQVLPKFLLNKHNPTHISKNELSLYFVAGLEWAGQFKDKSE